ncbi:hypothetical protein AO263_13830 [Pseudomonas sp. NZIPFR-PS5]|nr:hypothetical protein AO263_13830 [Pseudomonas sp. NZIPFR-PS5]
MIKTKLTALTLAGLMAVATGSAFAGSTGPTDPIDKNGPKPSTSTSGQNNDGSSPGTSTPGTKGMGSTNGTNRGDADGGGMTNGSGMGGTGGGASGSSGSK